jgi:NitT/TauT family transport system substrate-binding protein
MLKWDRLFALGILLLACSQSSNAQTLERKDIKLGIGGASQLIYLPATLALKLGYFKEQGLNVEINDFAGGAKSLQALVGGSVDLIAGAYDGAMRLQAKSQDVVAVCAFTRTYGATLGVRTDKAANFKSMADLKGMKIGVTAPGSGTQGMVWYLMAKAGVPKDGASFIGVGAGPGAVSAMQKGEIDAMSNLDPVMTKLETLKLVKVVAETRTVAGNAAVFGGSLPGIAVMTRRDFISKNPNTVQAVVNALYKTLKWMDAATPEQLAENVPPEFYAGDKPGYMAALKATFESYSRDGLVSPDGHQRSLDFLKRYEPEFANVNMDVSRVFDDRFVKKAMQAR